MVTVWRVTGVHPILESEALQVIYVRRDDNVLRFAECVPN